MKAIHIVPDTDFATELHEAMQVSSVINDTTPKHRNVMFDLHMSSTDVDLYNDVAKVVTELIFAKPHRIVGIALPEDNYFDLQQAIIQKLSKYDYAKRKYSSWDGLPNHNTYMWESDIYSRIILSTYESMWGKSNFHGRTIDYLIMLNMHKNRYFDEWTKAYIPPQVSRASSRSVMIGNTFDETVDDNNESIVKYRSLFNHGFGFGNFDKVFTKIQLL